MLGKGPTYGINGSFRLQEKKFSINFRRENTKSLSSFHVNGDNSYFLLMEKKSLNLNLINKNFNFPTQFCLRSKSNGFGATESREVSLKGDVYDFPVEYSAIDQSDKLNIPKYLMVQNCMK